MKTHMTFLLTGILILTTTIFSSCKKQDSILIRPLSLDIQGELGKYFEVVDDSYSYKVFSRKSNNKEYYGHTTAIKIKRNKQEFSFNIDSLENEATYRTTLFFDFKTPKGDEFQDFAGLASTIDDFKELLRLKSDSVMNVDFKWGCNYTKENLPNLPEGELLFQMNSVVFYKKQTITSSL